MIFIRSTKGTRFGSPAGAPHISSRKVGLRTSAMLFPATQSSSFASMKGPLPTGWREHRVPYVVAASRGTIDVWNIAST